MKYDPKTSRGMFYIVPIFMMLIFLLQIGLSHWANLSPWKGGGFGMFSSIDTPSMRVIHATGTDMQGNPVNIRVRFTGLGEKGPLTWGLGRYVRTFPTRGTLEEMARMMLAGEYVPYDEAVKVPDAYLQSFDAGTYYRMKYPYEKSDEVIRLREVTVTVLRMRYHTADQTVYYEPVLDPVRLNRERAGLVAAE